MPTTAKRKKQVQMMTSANKLDMRYGEALASYKKNNPPIKPGQYWCAYGKDGEVLRRVLILAPVPAFSSFSKTERSWIYEERPNKMMKEIRLSTCPEFNLRYVFKLEL
jgi:hypothetical protein